MPHRPSPPQPDPSNDPVWDLVKSAPLQHASPRFADDVLRSARNAKPEREIIPWIIGLNAAAAIIVTAFILFLADHAQPSAPQQTTAITSVAEDAPLDDLENAIETELLLAAVDHPEMMTDDEFAALFY